jgi:hypothetical protein
MKSNSFAESKRHLKIFESWKDEIDFDKFYTKNLTYFKVVGKVIPIHSATAIKYNPKLNKLQYLYFEGYVLYDSDTGFEAGEIFKNNMEYYEFKRGIYTESTPEEIEKYNMFKIAEKYNL